MAKHRKKLTELCDIQYGYAFDSGKFTEDEKCIPLVRIRDVKRGYSETFYCGEYPEEYVLHAGDLLVGMDGEFNIARWRSCDALLNQRVCKIVAKGNTDEEYLRFYLTKALKEIEDKTSFATVKHLSAKELNKLELDVPEYSEQKKLSGSLRMAEHIIELRKRELEELDDLIKSRFVEMFGDPVINAKSWKTAQLSALIINANNGMARRGKDEDGNIVLRLVELQNGFIDYSAPNRICLNETEKKRFELVDNDFLFARVNGNPDYVGRCAVFKSIDEPVFHNDHIIRVHFNETKINGCFMSVLLNSDYGKRQMREQIKTSAGQYTISQDGIGAIMAILPPLELQNQFEAFVHQIDKLKVEVQKSLDETQQLMDSLMQKYFG